MFIFLSKFFYVCPSVLYIHFLFTWFFIFLFTFLLLSYVCLSLLFELIFYPLSIFLYVVFVAMFYRLYFFLILCMFPSPAEVSKFNYFTPTLKIAGRKKTLKEQEMDKYLIALANSFYSSHPNPQNFKCMLKLLAFLHFIWKYGDMYMW